MSESHSATLIPPHTRIIGSSMRQSQRHTRELFARVMHLTSRINKTRYAAHADSIREWRFARSYTCFMTTLFTTCVRSVLACANSMRSIALAGFIAFAALASTASLMGCEGVSDNLPPAVITTKTAGIMRISTTGMGSKEIEESADALATMLSKSKIPQVVQASGLLQLQAAGMSSNPTMEKMDETMTALREIKAKV